MKRKQEVLNLIATNPGITIKQLSDQLGSLYYIRRLVTELRNELEITYRDGGYYTCNPDIPDIERYIRSLVTFGLPENIKRFSDYIQTEVYTLEEWKAIRQEVEIIIQFLTEPHKIRQISKDHQLRNVNIDKWVSHKTC